MTAHKHLKQLIRARMEKTGERYATARRQILGAPQPASTTPHFAGNVAAATALRAVLTGAGIVHPHSGEPLSEAMLFGLAGGIGIGLFTFYYEKADSASFYIAGRHQWHDDLAYLNGALEALRIRSSIYETAGAKTAARQLSEALSKGAPAIAWVDMASLPHRGMPDALKGMTYHVVTVYSQDEKAGTALIGDLTDDPVSISLKDLETARARIKKQQFRLLQLEPVSGERPRLRALVEDGLRRCRHGLLHPTLPQASGNARLEVLKTWAARLSGSKEPERWERIFRPGKNLWQGLNFVHLYIEMYGTGGGLCRPLFADFLEEAATAVRWPELKQLGAHYRELGERWSDLADAALPDGVPAFRKAKELRRRVAELRHDGGPAEEARAVWSELGKLESEAAKCFPLTEKQSAELREGLKARVLALYDAEAAGLEKIGKLVG